MTKSTDQEVMSEKDPTDSYLFADDVVKAGDTPSTAGISRQEFVLRALLEAVDEVLAENGFRKLTARDAERLAMIIRNDDGPNEEFADAAARYRRLFGN